MKKRKPYKRKRLSTLKQRAVQEKKQEEKQEELSVQTDTGSSPQEAAGEETAVNTEETADALVQQSPESAEAETDENENREYLLARKKVKRKKRIKRLAVLLCVLAFLAVLFFGLRSYIRVEEETLEVSFYHLESDKVTSSFRIVQLSDLHLHEFGEKNAVLVNWVRRLNPDIIAITGDMNNHYNDDTHVVTELCSQLTKITDVYYVMGNHEWVDHIDRHTSIKDDIVATGVTMLQNSYIETNLNGNKVFIGGLVNEVSNYSKYSGPKFMQKFMEEDGFKLLLVHYPEYFLGTLNDYSIDLAMCGHVHGGIIRIPGFGGLYASDQGFRPKLSEGMQTVDGGSVVVVSRGLGGEGSIPRINNNPEIVVVDVDWY